jgi:hypothetical protein
MPWTSCCIASTCNLCRSMPSNRQVATKVASCAGLLSSRARRPGPGLALDPRPLTRCIRVRAALRLTGSHGKKRLASFESLDLGFLVDAEHDRVIRRVHVEAHDVAHLLYEQRVVGKPKRLDAVRLQIEGAPDARHRGLRDPDPLRHVPGTPMRGIGRRALQRHRHDALDRLIAGLPGRSRPGLVHEPVEPLVQKATAPFADGGFVKTGSPGHLSIRVARCTEQDDARPRGKLLGRLPATDPSLERLTLLRTHFDRNQLSASSCHLFPHHDLEEETPKLSKKFRRTLDSGH